MKDYRGLPLKADDKVIIIHRLHGGANNKKTPHVVLATLDGRKSSGGGSAGIVYHSTLKGPVPPPKDSEGYRVAGDGGSFSLASYCDMKELMKVPDDIVDNPEAILAHIRMQGFEYE